MASKPPLAQGPVLSLLLAATLWGVIWYPLRLLAEHGLNGLWSSLVSYGVALLAGVLYAWRQELNWREDKAQLVLLALAAGWCNVAFVVAVIDGSVMRVLLLFYLSPLWSVLLGRWLLGERASRTALTVVGVALIGALVMLWDKQLGLPWPRVGSDWLALSSGFGFALSNVLVRKMHRVSLVAKTMVSWAGVVLVALAWIGCGGHGFPAVAPATVLAAAALGVFGIVIMTAAVQYGVTHMPVHRSAVILLFELVAGAVSSQLLTQEVISVREMVGGLLILVAAYSAARPATD